MQKPGENPSVDGTNYAFLEHTAFFYRSVPTPQVTDSINIAWAPTAPNKERVFRIDSKLSVDNEWKQDAIK